MYRMTLTKYATTVTEQGTLPSSVLLTLLAAVTGAETATEGATAVETVMEGATVVGTVVGQANVAATLKPAMRVEARF